ADPVDALVGSRRGGSPRALDQVGTARGSPGVGVPRAASGGQADGRDGAGDGAGDGLCAYRTIYGVRCEKGDRTPRIQESCPLFRSPSTARALYLYLDRVPIPRGE